MWHSHWYEIVFTKCKTVYLVKTLFTNKVFDAVFTMEQLILSHLRTANNYSNDDGDDANITNGIQWYAMNAINSTWRLLIILNLLRYLIK